MTIRGHGGGIPPLDTIREMESNQHSGASFGRPSASPEGPGSASTASTGASSYESWFYGDQDAFYDDDDDHLPGSNSAVEFSIASTSAETTPKFCIICGDQTSCLHYGVPSCTGCKTFFRRAVLSPKENYCKKNGSCDVMNGVKCRACRFDRCLAFGMNPENIIFPKDAEIACILDKVNRRKRNLEEPPKSLEEDETSKSLVLSSKNPVFELTLESRNIEFLCFLESKMRRLRESNYNPEPLYTSTVAEILRKKSALKTVDRYTKPPDWPLNNLLLVQQRMQLRDKMKGPPKRHWLSIDLILFIETAKTIPVIERLEDADKELVIKHSMLINAIFTEAYYSCCYNSETLQMPDGSIPIAMIPPHDVRTELHESSYTRVMEPFIRMRLTLEEYVLMKMIMACNPSVGGISRKSKSLLEKEFHRYSNILLKHVQDRLGRSPGAVRYSLLMAMYENMTHFCQKHKELHVYIQLKMLRMMANNPGRKPPGTKHRITEEALI